MNITNIKRINFWKRIFSSLLAVFVALGYVGCAWEGEKEPVKTVQSSGILTAKCLSYAYNVTKEEYGGESFEILCNGKDVVYQVSADYLGFISAPNEHMGETEDSIQARDIDGDGTPDLIIQQTNGNCCLDYTVVSLGDSLLEYKLQNVGADFELVDLDDDGRFEIKTTDTTFFEDPSGWKFDEPAPQVILEPQNGRYRFSQRFMKDNSPFNVSDQIDQAKEKVAATGEILPLNKDTIVEWVYRGHGIEALEYLDAVYDGTSLEDAKNEMADEIVSTLRGSPNWEEISAMNKWKYEIPEGELACPEFAGRGRLVKTK